ncbi:MAG: hypothetical protein ABIU09_12490 [Pyrinomonadaceae bacterium]
MKQCPACKTTYTDDSLSFCLADGTALLSTNDDQPTLVKAVSSNPLRVDIASTAATRDAVRDNAPIPESSSGTWIKIVLGVLILGVLAIGVVGLIGAAFYYKAAVREDDPVAKGSTPTPTPIATPTPDAEKEKLRDELANIQKKLDERKTTNADTRPAATPNQTLGISVTANSPSDGFLALRSGPSSEAGTRVVKIPHGSRLQIGACGDYITTKQNNYGRWCRASYSGYAGWVFDKFVVY